MSDTGRQRSTVLVCKACGQKIRIMDKIPKSMERLRKEFGFGEKCKE